MTQRKISVSALLTLAAASAHAHDGHGLGGSHWHPTDTLGFVGVVLAIGLVWWFSRGGR